MDKRFEETVLYKFLGAEESEELRKEIREVIVDQVRDELARNYNYILEPDSITDMLVGIINEAVEEVKEEYKEAAKEMIAKRLEGVLM